MQEHETRKGQLDGQGYCYLPGGENPRPAGGRLIDDPYAGRFLHAPFRLALKNQPLARLALWMAVECRFPGGYDTIVARIRCVDDALRFRCT